MNELIDLNQIQETDYLFTIFSFIICIICFFFKKTYEISSTSLTDKSQISHYSVISASTFLVILVVKSSLAFLWPCRRYQ